MVVEKCFKSIASSDAGKKKKVFVLVFKKKWGMHFISFISMGATLNPIIHVGYDSIVLRLVSIKSLAVVRCF
jgi:hypothetical protein